MVFNDILSILIILLFCCVLIITFMVFLLMILAIKLVGLRVNSLTRFLGQGRLHLKRIEKKCFQIN